ncbi:MAG: NCS2 family permease [Erysipelotrichaceae bacterium]|jgi:AGZA family xanthine/uracil permease-like MFS transporter
MIEKFFKLKENGTTVLTEVTAGLTTFAAMAYIIALNPIILSGLDGGSGAVYIATILSSGLCTILMGLIANVPYATAPGLGLNSLAAGLLSSSLGFSPAAILAIVLISGLINVLITVTNIRKHIIKSIPVFLQNAIAGGIGIFIIYIGVVNIGLVSFAGIPVINTAMDVRVLAVFLAGLATTIFLLIKKVPGAILIGVVVSTIVGIPLGITASGGTYNLVEAFSAYKNWFGIALTQGLGELFANPSGLVAVSVIILSFSISDNFDTIGTFVGTGRTSGIFTDEDIEKMETGHGFSSKMDKALFADAIATPIGAILGTSPTTTYVESAAGIGAGGKTGLVSLIVGFCFFLSLPFASLVSAIPAAATAPALVIVGVMMLSAFKEIDWADFDQALPAMGAGCFMALSYGITNGVMVGFFLYTFVETCKGNLLKLHPIILVSDILFIINLWLS